MSRVLIGSIRSLTPRLSVASAAKARLAANVSSSARRSAPGGAIPARQLSRAQPSSAGIIERARNAVAELPLAAGEDGDSPLAGLPVSGRKVEQRLGQTMVGEPPGDVARRVVIRRGVLDALEPGPRRRGEAVQERQLGEQKAQIGGKYRHARSSGDRRRCIPVSVPCVKPQRLAPPARRFFRDRLKLTPPR